MNKEQEILQAIESYMASESKKLAEHISKALKDEAAWVGVMKSDKPVCKCVYAGDPWKVVNIELCEYHSAYFIDMSKKIEKLEGKETMSKPSGWGVYHDIARDATDAAMSSFEGLSGITMSHDYLRTTIWAAVNAAMGKAVKKAREEQKEKDAVIVQNVLDKLPGAINLDQALTQALLTEKEIREQE